MNKNEILAYEMLEECTSMKTTTGKIIKNYYELTLDCAVEVMLNWYKKLSERQNNTEHSDNTKTKALHIANVSKWVAVKDALPDTDGQVFVQWDNGRYGINEWWESDNCWKYNFDGMVVKRWCKPPCC